MPLSVRVLALAASAAVREALRAAKPHLLEPVMAVQVDTPGEAQGDLIGDLNRRRGDVVSMESSGSVVQLNARVPLSELWGYANAIRSLSRGRASYSMTPSHFERVPEALVAKVIKKNK